MNQALADGEQHAADTTAEDTAAASQAENDNQDEGSHSDEGDKDNTHSQDDNTPFHKHPRWTEREQEWNKRFNEQEARHQDDLKQIREEFGAKRDANAARPKPSWFGGTDQQWEQYRKDQDAELKASEERVIQAIEKRHTDKTEQESKAVKEATDWLHTECDAIEADKTLNPSGAKVDRKKLLDLVVAEQLVDTKGRWNYRAGWKMLNSHSRADHAPNAKDKKDIAAASAGKDGGKGGKDGQATVATSETFRKPGARPW